MLTDPIADLLTRLRNASKVGKERAVVPYSRMKAAILAILAKEGVIVQVEEKLLGRNKVLEVALLSQDRAVIVPEFIRVSKPGRRIYVKVKDIPRPLDGYGIVILSTPLGLMTGKEARRKGVGGEILFKER